MWEVFDLLRKAADHPFAPVNVHFKTQSVGWETCYRAMVTHMASQHARAILEKWKPTPGVTTQETEKIACEIFAAKAAEEQVTKLCDDLEKSLKSLQHGADNDFTRNTKILVRRMTEDVSSAINVCIQTTESIQTLLDSIHTNTDNVPSMIPGADATRQSLLRGPTKRITVKITATWFYGSAIVTTNQNTDDLKTGIVSVDDNGTDKLRARPYAVAGRYVYETMEKVREGGDVQYGGPWVYTSSGECHYHTLQFSYAEIRSDQLEITLGGTSCHAFVKSISWCGTRFGENIV